MSEQPAGRREYHNVQPPGAAEKAPSGVDPVVGPGRNSSLVAPFNLTPPIILESVPHTVRVNHLVQQPVPGARRHWAAAVEDAEDTIGERGPALHYATIEDGFYISTKASALRSLIDRLRSRTEGEGGNPQGVKVNAMLYVAPRAAELARPTVSYLLEQQARRVSRRNLVQVWLLGRCGLLENLAIDAAAQTYLGYKLVCPDGGTYRYDATAGSAISSIHGSLDQPLRLDALPPESPMARLLDTIEVLTASLRFTEEGLATQVNVIRR